MAEVGAVQLLLKIGKKYLTGDMTKHLGGQKCPQFLSQISVVMFPDLRKTNIFVRSGLLSSFRYHLFINFYLFFARGLLP